MLTTSARLLDLLNRLHERRFWTGGELADALGVTTRSVRRDIDRLRELGYPVHATSGVGGGYALGAGADLPPLPLDDDEAVAVAVGLRAAATGVVAGLEQASLRALAKLERVLPRRLRSQVSALNAVSVQMMDGVARVDAEVLTSLAGGCRDEHLVTFDYLDRAGTRSARTVEPYKLVHSSARWYLLAFDRDRQDWRTFRVDRVVGPPAELRRFTPRALPADDVAAWVAERITSEGSRVQGRVTVHASADALIGRVSDRWGRLEPIAADRCALFVRGDHLEWMAVMLGLLGVDFEVHDPPELVDAVARLGARMVRASS